MKGSPKLFSITLKNDWKKLNYRKEKLSRPKFQSIFYSWLECLCTPLVRMWKLHITLTIHTYMLLSVIRDTREGNLNHKLENPQKCFLIDLKFYFCFNAKVLWIVILGFVSTASQKCVWLARTNSVMSRETVRTENNFKGFSCWLIGLHLAFRGDSVLVSCVKVRIKNFSTLVA